MSSFTSLIPLLLTAAILLGGNGLQGTLVALRADAEGFGASAIGVMGTSYFAGFMIACVVAPRLVQAVGHIRVFAALAALAATGTLLLVIVLDPLAWIVIRFAMGFSFSGLFTVVESWLNSASTRANRGRMLSVYRIIDLLTVTGVQFLLPLFGPESFTIFALVAIFFTLSLVPVSLADRSNPRPPENFTFDLKAVWAISPLASVGAFAIGLTNSAFRLVGPVYATSVGLDVAGVALFISAGIFGGSILQYPLGHISDRIDRRLAIMLATGGAVLAGLFLSFGAGTSPQLIYLGAFLFGAFAMPLYSLSAANANDHAEPGQYVLIAAGLTFFFSIGAMIGPVVAAEVIELWGPAAFFGYTSLVHGALLVVSAFRMTRRPAPPRAKRSRFVALLRTSPVMYRLARNQIKRRRERAEDNGPSAREP